MPIALMGLMLVGAAPTNAQDAQREQPERAPVNAPPPHAGTTGPFTAFGRFVDESIAELTSGFKGTRNSLDDIGGQAGDVAKGAAKDATDAVTRLPRTSFVRGHALCPIATNGAPDCRTTTVAMCRAKGFETGRSLDVQTEQICPAHVWASGREPAEGECRLEHYVMRALCQ